MSVSSYSAPAKVILFGEHFVVHGASSVLCAINRRVTVSVQGRHDDSFSLTSDKTHAEFPMSEPSPYPMLAPFHHMARAMDAGGINMYIKSHIPSGAGLGSSSACCVASAGALLHMIRVPRTPDILEMAMDAERVMQPNSSGADCAACTYGGIIKYTRNPSPKIEPQYHDPSRLVVVVSNSGMAHSTAAMVNMISRMAHSAPQEFAPLLERADTITGMAIDAIREEDIPRLGRLASENQKLLERIGVSNSTLQDMIRIADAYSYGSKITGAGGGGCIIAITDDTNTDETIDALSSAGFDTFGASISAGGIVE